MPAEFEGWAIVELMGHRKLAGYVREVTIAGAAVLRLDIPSEPAVTQYYGASSLYCLTPTTEAFARAAAQVSRPTPISRYELPEPRSAERSAEDDDDYLPDEPEHPAMRTSYDEEGF